MGSGEGNPRSSVGYNQLMIRKAVIILLTLAAVATVVLWIRDGLTRTPETLWRPTLSDDAATFVVVSDGSIDFVLATCSVYLSQYESRYEVAGFTLQIYEPGEPVCSSFNLQVGVPIWFLFVLFAAYPTIAFIRGPVWRYWRCRKGLCVKCGYNLTGNVSGVCPECGSRTTKGPAMEIEH